MGLIVVWAEGMAAALLCLALVCRWSATRGSFIRVAVLGFVFLAFAAPAAIAAHAVAPWQSAYGGPLATDLFALSLSWLLVFLLGGTWLVWQSQRRPEPGLARAGASWPRSRLWWSLGGAGLALAFTFWNLNLAARADMASARQEAADLLFGPLAIPADAERTDRAFREAEAHLTATLPADWREAALGGWPGHEQPRVDWKSPALAAFVAKQEKGLALLRKAAALPGGKPNSPRSLNDPYTWHTDRDLTSRRRDQLALLALDARVKAAGGEVARAFDDLAALLGFTRHLPGMLSGPEAMRPQFIAWRTLEDVLRLAPPGKGLPVATFPEVISPLRILHQEMAVLAVIFPALLADDPLRFPEFREFLGAAASPPLAWLTEGVATPGARAFFTPAELRYSRQRWQAYRLVLQRPPQGEPRDWQAARAMVHTEPAGLFSVLFVKPKEKKLLRDAGQLTALEQLARAGLAAARYRDKHGRLPQRLEQLVPDFLPAMPTDPRDGQGLRMKHFPDVAVLHTAADSPGLEDEKTWSAEKHKDEPIFRLYPRAAK